MRRCITLAVQKKGTQDIETRLYVMSHGQATAFRDAVCRTMGARDLVEQKVEKAIVHLLAGRQPTEDDAPEIVRLAGLFPKLSTVQVEALLRAGCPPGWIESLILTVNVQRGRGGRRDIRHVSVRYDMSTDQQREFNNTIVALQGMFGLSRDVAWQKAQNLAQRLLGGEIPKTNADDVVRQMASVFEATSLDDLLKRPRADEQDLMRWAFTREPS